MVVEWHLFREREVSAQQPPKAEEKGGQPWLEEKWFFKGTFRTEAYLEHHKTVDGRNPISLKTHGREDRA